MYLQKVISRKTLSHRHGSADPDPDPHQNVMYPQGYFTWSGERGYIPYTPRCGRHRRAGVTSPGVEGEDIFRILPGVGDAGVPVVEGEADHQVAAGLQHRVAAHKPTHLMVRYTYR